MSLYYISFTSALLVSLLNGQKCTDNTAGIIPCNINADCDNSNGYVCDTSIGYCCLNAGTFDMIPGDNTDTNSDNTINDMTTDDTGLTGTLEGSNISEQIKVYYNDHKHIANIIIFCLSMALCVCMTIITYYLCKNKDNIKETLISNNIENTELVNTNYNAISILSYDGSNVNQYY
mmetsp:Transcript_31835/g.39113  ORF Transcript_31835/g.39113 Transcript_31835/m.39113 type:complete len:176 (+) Transcript_31835:87-614(+)